MKRSIMDEQALLHACELVSEGKYSEAYREFIQLAENTPDPLEKAWPLIYAANALQTLGQEEAATTQLSAVRALIEKKKPSSSAKSEEFAAAEFFLDFEEANFLWVRGGNQEAALNRFDAVLKKHGWALKYPGSRSLKEAIRIRRAFILADLGRWKEALPILEGITSPQEYEEGVAFYLGHCCVEAGTYQRAEEKLNEALNLGLPSHLEYRAHCELGITYYHLQNYPKAKDEFEKGSHKADPTYIKQSQIWKWLEITCRALGLKAEAEHYSQMAHPS
jgi:tetratricopeptide (TPR) repeat protein